jgi:hypothetical protein
MEETGMAPGMANVIGQLTCLHIPVSNIQVFPFVAEGPPVSNSSQVGGASSFLHELNTVSPKISIMPVNSKNFFIVFKIRLIKRFVKVIKF